MTIPSWLLTPIWWSFDALLSAAGIAAALALALSFGGPRQRLLAKILWPLVALSFWSSACVFMAAARATGFQQAPPYIPLADLVLPASLWIPGAGLSLWWFRSRFRQLRSGKSHAELGA